jgi:hypothetical protein
VVFIVGFSCGFPYQGSRKNKFTDQQSSGAHIARHKKERISGMGRVFPTLMSGMNGRWKCEVF